MIHMKGLWFTRVLAMALLALLIGLGAWVLATPRPYDWLMAYVLRVSPVVETGGGAPERLQESPPNDGVVTRDRGARPQSAQAATTAGTAEKERDQLGATRTLGRAILVLLGMGGLYAAFWGFLSLMSAGSESMIPGGRPGSPLHTALSRAASSHPDWDAPLADSFAAHRRVAHWLAYLGNALILIGLIGNFVGLADAVWSMADALKPQAAISQDAHLADPQKPNVVPRTLPGHGRERLEVQPGTSAGPGAAAVAEATSRLTKQAEALQGIRMVVVGSVLGIGGMILVGFLGRALTSQAEELHRAQTAAVLEQAGGDVAAPTLETTVLTILRELQEARWGPDLGTVEALLQNIAVGQGHLYQAMQGTSQSFEQLGALIGGMQRLPDTVEGLIESMADLRHLIEGPMQSSAQGLVQASTGLAAYAEDQAARDEAAAGRLREAGDVVLTAAESARECASIVTGSRRDLAELTTSLTRILEELQGSREELSASWQAGQQALEHGLQEAVRVGQAFQADALDELKQHLGQVRATLEEAAGGLRSASTGLHGAGERLDENIGQMTQAQVDLCRTTVEQLARVEGTVRKAEESFDKVQAVLTQLERVLEGFNRQGDRLVNQTLDRLDLWIQRNGTN